MPNVEIPTFKIRGRVTSVGGNAPSGKNWQLSFDWGGAPFAGQQVSFTDANWSGWLIYDADEVAQFKPHGTGNTPSPIYLAAPHQQSVITLRGGVVDPTNVEFEVVFDETPGTTHTLTTSLFDVTCAFVLRRNAQDVPIVQTYQGWCQQYYWPVLASHAIPAAERPSQIRIVDILYGDGERQHWIDGMSALRGMGVNTLLLTGQVKPKAAVAAAAGISKIAIGVEATHSSWHDFDNFAKDPLDTSPSGLAAWAAGQVAPYLNAGYAASQIATMAIYDEGAFFYGNNPIKGAPGVVTGLNNNADGLARFRQYLQDQGLTPADVGHSSWSTVFAPNRDFQAGTLQQRRLFFWTARFMAYDSAKYKARKSAALKNATHQGLRTYTNWHTWRGRIYTAGPGNYYDPGITDGEWEPGKAASGGEDWFETSRLQPGTLLHSEDWYEDYAGHVTPWIANRMWSAAAKNNLEVGNYVMGFRSIHNGMARKALTNVGHGVKHLVYYFFGPLYTTGSDGYGELAVFGGTPGTELLQKIAYSNKIIARAEHVLFPGKPQETTIAMLFPRSANAWDTYNAATPTNRVNDPFSYDINWDVDYSAELRCLFHCLMNLGIQIDFIDEDDLLDSALMAKYKVIYATEPNIPAAGQTALSQWVSNGGWLAKVTKTGTADIYNEPTSTIGALGGITEDPRNRWYTGPDTRYTGWATPDLGLVTGGGNSGPAYGVRGNVTATNGGTIEATFADATPAIVSKAIGSGGVIHYAFSIGLSYILSGTVLVAAASGQYQVSGYSGILADWIRRPLTLANAKPIVEVTGGNRLVEAPVLISPAGAAITLVNWNTDTNGRHVAVSNLTVRYRHPATLTPAQVKRASTNSTIPFTQTSDGILFDVATLDDGDVIMVTGEAGEPPPPSSVETWGLIPA